MTEARVFNGSGVREIDPRPRRFYHAIAITRQESGTIRRVIGWIRPLEYYTKTPLDLLEQYLQLILLSRENGGLTEEGIGEMMLEAKERLPGTEYERLLGYKEFLAAHSVRQ